MINTRQFAQHRNIEGVHFLRLKGTLAERAFLHGQILADSIRTGALPPLAKKNEWLIRRSPGVIGQWPILQDLLVRLYQRLLIPLVDRTASAEVQAMTRALAEGSGLPHSVVRGGLYQAEGMMLLSRMSVMRYLMREYPAGALPGCSSGVVLGGRTQSGRLLVARNQDYPVVGYWETHTTLLFQEPTEPGHIPHIDVTTAGVHTGGLTSMNREGLTLSAHAHFGRRMSWTGATVVDLGNRIIERARTLGEAVDFARAQKRHANWAYVVSSAKENTAAVLEMTPDRVVVREPEDGVLAHSNYFQSEELRDEEANMSGSCTEDMKARACRMRELLIRAGQQVVPGDLAQILGDQVDPFTQEERLFGNTLGVVTTIKSAVMDPGEQTLFVSSRKETPVPLAATFLKIRGDEFWQKDEARAREEALTGAVRGYQPQNPRLVEAMREYREAYRAWHMHPEHEDRAERAWIAIQNTVRILPTDPNLRVQAGIFAVHLGKAREALAHFEQASQSVLSQHTRDVIAFFQGRCFDIEGERAQAIERYQSVLARLSERSSDIEPRLQEALKAGLRRPYRSEHSRNLHVDLQFPDVFAY